MAIYKARVLFLAALYPGTLYLPSEPLLLASLKNQYILRCQDGVLVDGNDRRLSKSIFKSCAARDRFGWDHPCCDLTWLTPSPINPMNVGQYVNNADKCDGHNVIYQECLVPLPSRNLDSGLPLDLWKYLPNVWYDVGNRSSGLRLVPLVAVRDIEAGQEIFSSYFTIVHDK